MRGRFENVMHVMGVWHGMKVLMIGFGTKPYIILFSASHT